MTEPRDVAGILRDISVLYELSLSVGRSIDFDENCDGFLRTLMARKSLDFASVWIRDRARDEETDDGWTQAYANPAFRAPLHRLAGGHALPMRLDAEMFFSVAHGQPGFEDIVTETDVDRGAFAIYRLGDIGLLKLYSIARTTPFSHVELSKLRHVIEKFTISLEGCLDHARVRTAEKHRRELEQQMLHTQKLESLGLLAGGVAHDFNNLLTVVLGNAELVKPSVGRDVRENVDNIAEAAARAAGLCSQLLAYSGRGHFVIGPVSLGDVVDEMLRLTAVTVSKKVVIRRDLAPSLPAIEGDEAQVQQVVMNLVTNASEAIGDTSGELSVTTGLVEVTSTDLEEFTLGDQRDPGEYVCLEVEDSGCGMDSATRQRVFDPFFTTKFTGRGLGLAAVLGIVRGHHGAIRVRSSPGQGTQVRVLFPASRSAVAAARDVEVPDGRSWRGTVLVVDDEEPVRIVLGKLFAKLGFDVIYAADGGEALRIYTARSHDIDLVAVDLTMPVMNGDEVFRRIVDMDPSARVILMSGYSELDVDVHFEGPHPAAFLSKPFRAADLRRVVRAALPEHAEDVSDASLANLPGGPTGG